MKINQYGQVTYNSQEIFEQLYENADLSIASILGDVADIVSSNWPVVVLTVLESVLTMKSPKFSLEALRSLKLFPTIKLVAELEVIVTIPATESYILEPLLIEDQAPMSTTCWPFNIKSLASLLIEIAFLEVIVFIDEIGDHLMS